MDFEPSATPPALRALAAAARSLENDVRRDGVTESHKLSALLCEVARAGDAEELARLLSLSDDGHVLGDYDGRTPLHLACAHGQTECVDACLEAGVDASIVDGFGRTPLLEAVLAGEDAIVAALRARGAELGLVPHKAAEAMNYAASVGDAGLCARYLDAGLDVAVTDYDGRTALHVAAAEGNYPLCKQLMDRGADATAADRWGHKPKHEAKRFGHDSDALVKLLETTTTTTTLDHRVPTPTLSEEPSTPVSPKLSP